jgi:protein CMS1
LNWKTCKLQVRNCSAIALLRSQVDVQIEKFIADTTVWTEQRTLDQLGDFIAKGTCTAIFVASCLNYAAVLPSLRTRLSQRSKAKGAPTLLFITGAALRVVDVTRVLKDKKIRGEKGGEIAKLFARHFKLEEHVSYLKRTKIGVAVGTPGRIGKLLCETGGWALTSCSRLWS